MVRNYSDILTSCVQRTMPQQMSQQGPRSFHRDLEATSEKLRIIHDQTISNRIKPTKHTRITLQKHPGTLPNIKHLKVSFFKWHKGRNTQQKSSQNPPKNSKKESKHLHISTNKHFFPKKTPHFTTASTLRSLLAQVLDHRVDSRGIDMPPCSMGTVLSSFFKGNTGGLAQKVFFFFFLNRFCGVL